jgi:hypothetical protein
MNLRLQRRADEFIQDVFSSVLGNVGGPRPFSVVEENV